MVHYHSNGLAVYGSATLFAEASFLKIVFEPPTNARQPLPITRREVVHAPAHELTLRYGRRADISYHTLLMPISSVMTSS